MTRSGAPSARVRRRLAHRLADDLAAAEHGLVAAGAVVLGRPRSSRSVSASRMRSPVVGPYSAAVAGAVDAHAIARCRRSRSSAADGSPRRPATIRAPTNGTRSTSSAMPGSKRTAVPGGDVEPVPARRGAVERRAPGWPRRSGSANRPGPAGRRRSRRAASITGRPALISIGSSGPTISPGTIAVTGIARSGDRVVQRDELGAVGERRLDLDLVEHLGDALHHVVAGEHVAAGLHQVGDRRPSRAASSTQAVSMATASG